MYQEWLNMEHFYYYQFSWMAVIAVILAVIVVSIILYVDRTGVKIVASLIILALLGMFAFIWQQYHTYQDLINQAALLNPAVRDFERKLFYLDENYPSSYRKLYRESYYQPLFEELDMYEENFKQEPVEYLGRSDRGSYYVQIDQDVYVMGSTYLEFTDQVETPQRMGVQYQLVDQAFQEIGFVDQTHVYLLSYQIPTALEDKLINDESPQTELHQGVVHHWITPGS